MHEHEPRILKVLATGDHRAVKALQQSKGEAPDLIDQSSVAVSQARNLMLAAARSQSAK